MAKIAFLFPGQGAQTVGMGKQLADELPAVSQLFEQANDILGYDLAEICFNGPTEKLNSTNHSQPALFVCSLAAAEKIKQENPGLIENCSAAAGLSLGEYTAMVFAGSLTFEEGLKVVQRRGEAMQEASEQAPSGMVSILGMDLADVEQLCVDCRDEQEILQVANHLCPGNIAISGHKTACEKAAKLAPERGAMRAIPLAVSGAFHTELMRSAVTKLEDALSTAEIKPPRIPVISNVDAQAHDDPNKLRDILVSQVCSPVLWEKSMQHLIDEGYEQFYEIGPGSVLKGLLKRIARKVPCESVPA